ncbi:U3 snoRNP protein Utp20 [Delitschia confertaspora ATCC 74209]|uniref:U3 snoRNP protein Utp20 n=1 Tax=Delitschia confertaspora ATCC 74209 TaxID=1513339 RepID=A0A9P4JC40_9PLEO|nr:U3 snoRNP protein Utp20 [Delitschia confertaspora ATCC 74209]
MAIPTKGSAARSQISKKPTGITKKRKGGTETTRKHRFESFSQRIAKLKIEPVRRGRSTILDDAELDTTFSYFKTSLDEWRDLNTSDGFTNFARQVAPLCESLPQLVHYNERILDLLIQYIEKGDKWSEEPLLSLMAHFAHDLGARFEKHFERVVKTVSQLAAKHEDVAVIEWSFTCLAWLFKYLSRLLVPDLRPVFDLMAPLLGTEHQKSFVTGFTAEALSFLLRKAGSSYHRDKEPLKRILAHIVSQLDALRESGNDREFQHGVMSLFVDSMKGVQRGLHSNAVAIMQELLAQAYGNGPAATPSPALEPVLTGVIIAIIHHSEAETFGPLLELVLAQIRSALTTSPGQGVGLSLRLLYTVAGVRKGSRILDWKPVLETLALLSDTLNQSGQPTPSEMQDTLACYAVVFQYCPIDCAIPHVQLLESTTKNTWEEYFLPFCNLFAELGAERFKSLLLPYFKRFVISKADKHGDELCITLPKLYKHDALSKNSVSMPAIWCDEVLSWFQKLADPALDADLDRLSYACNAFLEMSYLVSLEADFKEKVLQHLFTLLENATKDERPNKNAASDTLAAGHGFLFLVHQSKSMEAVISLWPSLCAMSTVYGHSIPFWHALRLLVGKCSGSLDLAGPHVEPLKRSLMNCLGSPSHDLRLAALEILDLVVGENEETKTMINTALMTEQTPFTMQNSRSVSMHIRKLGANYEAVSSDKWAGEAVPTYCFGLLHVKLAQVWDDACSALQKMCETKEGEAFISQIAFEWLRDSETESFTPPSQEEDSYSRRYATEFECTHLQFLDIVISKHRAASETLPEQIEHLFQVQHFRVPFTTAFSRTQALRVLSSIPQVAEKRSRLLVPVLLNWVLDSDREPVSAEVSDDDTLTGESPAEGGSHWNRKDQKAMLSVFSKFNNPKVLFKSAEVYSALLTLLANGDVEIQKASLKAITTWKEPAIIRYQENLFNLLDDARFREEISVFMDVSEEDSHLQEQHRDQVLPVILRLLYGKVISGRKGQEAKRKAVFVALTRFEQGAIRQFLNIATGPLSGASILKNGSLDEDVFGTERMSPRKQLGFLNMLEDMLTTLKTTLAPFIGDIVDPLLYCLIKASRPLNQGNRDDEAPQDHHLSLLRTIRQRAFHSLNILFESSPEFNWSPYMPTIVDELVNPRLAQFAIETAQSVSGLLRLFAAWSNSLDTAPFLVEFNPDIVTRIVECLEVPSAKDAVRLFVLDNVLGSVVRLVESDDDSAINARIKRNRIHSEIIQPYANVVLGKVGDLLRKSPSKDVLESGVRAVAGLAPHVVGSSESRSMIEIATFLLRQPAKRVGFQTKQGLLQILLGFIPRCDESTINELLTSILDSCCPLFATAPDPKSRTLLCNIVRALCESQKELEIVAQLCEDLNSFSAARLDEPDFDRRSKAFDIINDEKYNTFSPQQWQPLIYNMLFYIKDNDELSIRINASLSLRRFVDATVDNEQLNGLLSSAVLPGIQQGMRETSELVRVEFLALLTHLITTRPDFSPTADLRAILSQGADDESSFFDNVLHIQSHRRLRALRRLATNTSKLHSASVYQILIPLLEHFIFNKAEDEGAHNLAGETVRTLGVLTEWLEWPQFRSLIKRYIGYLKTKEDMQKTMIKLLSSMMDSLSRAGHAKGYASAAYPEEPDVQAGSLADGESMDVDKPTAVETMDVDKPVSTLSKTLPQQEKLSNDLTKNILPSLTEFLHNKDESTVSLRVPIAVAVVKVLQVLPPQEIEARLPAVLLDICHILKSKSQDARDMSRNTLTEVAVLMGPSYVGFILKSLRTALQRGYQLHVLSFTLHHILVKLSPEIKPGLLDYCLPDIVAIVMDDIFGVTGQEKDAEEYISKMKEVKSSKSYDTMDIVARIATPTHLVDLIAPMSSLLQERLNVKMVQKIDELLRRIGLGVLQNPTVKDRDILMFCYELIQEVYKASSAPTGVKQDDMRNKRYLINMHGAAKSGVRGSTSSYIYKITRFGLDILRTVLRKHEELQTPQNLTGFLPIIGDALVQGQEEVQISAIRLLTTIIRVPLAKLDTDCPVYVAEAVRNIKNAPSTNTELAQASLKLISAILRDRRNVEVKERDLAQLLKRLLPDLDEPDRQGVTFGFLKAIMNRKIVITEVYEVMEKVAVIMVTNHTRSARDLARSHYFQFLTEYPQTKTRFNKQVEFLIRNLRYEHVEGRQSVMEALHLMLTKVGDNVLQDVLGMLFIPLVHSMANDDSSDCRTMAGALLKKLFERADDERTKGCISDLRGWLEQDQDTGLKRLGIQCWGLYFEVAAPKPKELRFILQQLETIIQEGLIRRDEDDWELIYYSLTVFSKLVKTSPEQTLSPDHQSFWTAVRTCASYPHSWVKLTAAKLLGTYFADLASTNGEAGLHNLPLVGSQGLQLTAVDMIQLTNGFLKNLHIPDVSEELCAQTVRNLAFLARCLAVNGATWNWKQVDDDEDVGDDALQKSSPEETANGEDGEEWGGLSDSGSPPPAAAATIPTATTQPPPAIHRLLTRLSALIRRETKIMKLASLFPKTATMTLLETLCHKLPLSSLTPSLHHLLTTLSTLTDPATTIPRSTDPAFNDTYKALIDKAREIMDALQKRMGTGDYLKIIQEVQKGIRGRREERRTKRKVDAVVRPEEFGREKRRRQEVKRVRKKEKGQESRGVRRGW